MFEKIENQRRALLADQLRQDLKNLEEGTKERIALQQRINELEQDFGLDIDSLLSIEDTVELNKRLTALNVSEKQRTVLRTLIRDQKTATQDLSEAQNDLNDASAETLELNKEIILQEAALLQLQGETADSTKALEKLEEDRLKLQKANLRARIDDLEENSIERLKLEKELNDLLIQEQEDANQKRLDEQKKQQEKEAELREKGIALLREALQKRNEEQLAAIDNELSAEEARIDRLQELANQDRKSTRLNSSHSSVSRMPSSA